MFRWFVRVVVLTSLVGSLTNTSVALECSFWAEISPTYQERVVGSSAAVELSVSTCGTEATAVVFEILGPHPTVQVLDSSGGQFPYSYEGVVSGIDHLRVTLQIDGEQFRGEAQVRWRNSEPSIADDVSWVPSSSPEVLLDPEVYVIQGTADTTMAGCGLEDTLTMAEDETHVAAQALAWNPETCRFLVERGRPAVEENLDDILAQNGLLSTEQHGTAVSAAHSVMSSGWFTDPPGLTVSRVNNWLHWNSGPCVSGVGGWYSLAWMDRTGWRVHSQSHYNQTISCSTASSSTNARFINRSFCNGDTWTNYLPVTTYGYKNGTFHSSFNMWQSGACWWALSFHWSHRRF